MKKKAIRIACCALGGGLIGYFARELDTWYGGMLFAMGIALLTGSIAAMNRQGK